MCEEKKKLLQRLRKKERMQNAGWVALPSLCLRFAFLPVLHLLTRPYLWILLWLWVSFASVQFLRIQCELVVFLFFSAVGAETGLIPKLHQDAETRSAASSPADRIPKSPPRCSSTFRPQPAPDKKSFSFPVTRSQLVGISRCTSSHLFWPKKQCSRKTEVDHFISRHSQAAVTGRQSTLIETVVHFKGDILATFSLIQSFSHSAFIACEAHQWVSVQLTVSQCT